MKRKYIFLLAIICIFLIAGCGDPKKKQVEILLNAAEEYIKKDDFNNAIQKYEDVFKLSNDSKYKSIVNDLKIKQKNQKDIIIVNKTIDELKRVLLSPDSLQVNKIIIWRAKNGNSSVYMDYSAINKMGGYTRDYAYAAFSNEVLNQNSFFPNFESNYRSAEKNLGKDNTYYFDLNLLKLK